jgi:hypothetical protein
VNDGIALALRALHRGERNLAGELARVAERHRAEHEVHHVATDLAGWSREHVRRIVATAADREVDLTGPPEAGEASDAVFTSHGNRSIAETADALDPGLLLLRDLRELHLSATANSLHWEMLAQLAQAAKDPALLSLASACHPQTLRQMRWTNTMIKTMSPQVLTSL